MAFLGAQQRFRLNSPSGYNIPKMPFMFYVNFVSRFLDPEFIGTTSFFVKTFERINFTYDIQEVNQYNKKRLIQTGIKYGPLAFSFYDVVDNHALQLIQAYSQFYYGDFRNKDDNSWNYDITTNNFEYISNWGLQADQSPNNGYFFDRIELYEVYDQTYTKISFINPKFTSVDFQTFNSESSDPMVANMVCKYEGIVVDSVNEIVTPDIAELLGLPLVNDLGSGIGGFRLPGFANIINAGTDLLSNVFSSFGLNPLVSNIAASTLVGAGLSALGPKVNTTFGEASFNPLSLTSQLVESVGIRTAAGQSVRDVGTGSFTSGSTPLFF